MRAPVPCPRSNGSLPERSDRDQPSATAAEISAQSTREPFSFHIAILHAVPGRARLNVGGLKRCNPLAETIRSGLLSLPGVETVAASPLTGNVTVEHDVALATPAIVDHLSAVLRGDISAPAASGAEARPPWHTLETTALAERLESSADAGLSEAAARDRLGLYGRNIIPKPQKRSELDILLGQFNNLPVGLLAGAGTISLLTGAVVDAAAILAVVAANAGIGFATERQAERTIDSLGITGARMCKVKRDGTPREVPVDTLVPGDVIELQGGNAVPADARLITTQGLTVSEAALTGESVPILKSAAPIDRAHTALGERKNMVYRGTIVTGGTATAMVVATGAQTELGRIQRLVSATQSPQTPLQRELGDLGTKLGWLTLGATGVMLGVGVLRGFGLLETTRSALALAVAAVPEGLSIVATTTLAFGADALRRRGVLVRQLNAIETLAAAKVICFDKTGTLTLNKMSVAKIAAGDRIWRMNNDVLIQEATAPKDPLSDARLKELLTIATLCNDSTVEKRDDKTVFTGSGTESALLRAAFALGLEADRIRGSWPRTLTRNRTETNRYMATIHSAPDGTLVAVKGSPPEMAALCTDELAPDGSCHPLTRDRLQEIERLNVKMASDGLRVLGMACRRLPAISAPPEIDKLTWLGCVGLSDQLRQGIPELMRHLHTAGVQTVLLTGDQKETAVAVAGQTEVGTNGSVEARDGADLEGKSGAELGTAVRGVDAFSRVSPTQKLNIVRALQREGATVAMIGDGINDGPALRAANIGLGIGRDNGAAAREIAHAFIASDDLSGLLAAVEQGRTTHANIRKAIRYLLSTNLSEVLLMLASTVLGTGATLTPMQLLWINLVTDVLPGLGLALEPAEKDTMQRAPTSADATIVGTRDLTGLVGEAAMLTIGPFIAGLYGALRYGARTPQSWTLAFGSLVTGQLLHAISCRSRTDGIFGPAERAANKPLAGIMIGTAAVQGMALLVPALRRILGIAPVGPVGVLIAAAGGIAPFAICELEKVRRGALQAS